MNKYGEITEWFKEYEDMGIGYTRQHELWNRLKLAQSMGHASWQRVGNQITKMIFEEAELEGYRLGVFTIRWAISSEDVIRIDWNELVKTLEELEESQE